MTSVQTERTQTDSLEVEYEKAEENPARYANPAEALEQLELSERVHRALLKVSEDLRDSAPPGSLFCSCPQWRWTWSSSATSGR